MPTDYVTEIRKLGAPRLMAMLQAVAAGVQPRGWAKGKAFEHIILRSFEIEGAEVVWPYEVKHEVYTLEQIDGVVYYDGINCLIESKDYKDPLNIEPVAKLRMQLMRRPAGAMGIFFARGDFSRPMKGLTRMMNPLQILLWRFDELGYALEGKKMCPALQLKYRRALEFGMPDFDVRGEL